MGSPKKCVCTFAGGGGGKGGGHPPVLMLCGVRPPGCYVGPAGAEPGGLGGTPRPSRSRRHFHSLSSIVFTVIRFMEGRPEGERCVSTGLWPYY